MKREVVDPTNDNYAVQGTALHLFILAGSFCFVFCLRVVHVPSFPIEEGSHGMMQLRVHHEELQQTVIDAFPFQFIPNMAVAEL